MAASVEFVVSGDPATAEKLVKSTLQAEGFELEPTPVGGLIASRSRNAGGFWGSLFGSRAGTSFIVEFTVDPDSRFVVRWNASVAAGVITGNLAGENPSDELYRKTADALAGSFEAAGLLIDRRNTN